LAFTSCKSSESAYRKAYEKAKAQETTQTTTEVTETPVVTPIVSRPATTSTATVDNATVRSEDVTVVSGSGLRAYSVVVGSFSLKANAEGLQSQLQDAGYDAQIVYNGAISMYRVVASTYDSKADAVNSRNQFRSGRYPDAWLLFKN